MALRKLKVIYILPSRYDDDGYVLRYWRGVLPSNTLCTLKTLTEDAARSGALGPDTVVDVETYDDTVQAVPLARIIKSSRRDRDSQLLVGIVGVQSNQFPRATDFALKLRAEGIQVAVGGFHVSGVLAMFDAPSPELQHLLDQGVSLVRGEAEAPGFMEGFLRDALMGEMKPLYEVGELPSLEHAAVPQPDTDYLKHFVFQDMGTIDTSRGCPYGCSFCTVINVQGRTMRSRSAACILRSIEDNFARGITFYFFTDDNFARSPVWEPVLNGLIDLRARGIHVQFMMQVDTQAYLIPGFVEKASKAGCYLVFIGIETINPENVVATGKAQNKVDEFASMVEAWRAAEVVVHAAYMIGLPFDTPESVRQNVLMLRDNVKADMASFFMVTPLPGSLDHKRMVKKRVPIDADLNSLDSFHETYRHPNFAPGEWRAAYYEAWDAMYNKEAIVTALLRTPKSLYWKMFVTYIWYRYCTVAHSHPMVTGLMRLKERSTRRPTFPRENMLRYAWRRAKDIAWGAKTYAKIFFEFQEIWLLTHKTDDPRWRTLADLRAKFADMRHRVMESDLGGRCDMAMRDVRAMLHAASERLRALSANSHVMSARMRKRLTAKAAEIDAYVRMLDMRTPSWERVIKAEQYISENLVAWYENMVIRYVARQRQFNAFRSDLFERIKSGRVWGIDLIQFPKALLFEFVVGVRFLWHFLTKPRLRRTGQRGV